MADILPSENQIRLNKICEEHDVNKLLEFIKNKKNLKDVYIHGSFETACINHSARKNEFLDIFLNNQNLKKDIIFSHICSVLIDVNDFELFKQFSPYVPITELERYINQTIKNGNIDFFKKILSNYSVDTSLLHEAMVKACEVGQSGILKYLFANYDIDVHFNNDLAVRRAGSNNHIDIVKYLLEDKSLKQNANSSTMNDDLSICAIMQENKQLLDYLYNDYGMKPSKNVIDYKQYKQDLATKYK